MNKKLKNYFEQLGFSIKGNNAHGEYKDYEVSVDVAMLDTVSPVKLHVNLFATNEVKAEIVKDIKGLKFKYFNVDMDLYGIILGFNDPLTVGKLLKRMPEMMTQIFDVFTKYGAKGVGYCPICGEELKDESNKYKIGWALITMDNDCVKDVNEVIDAENEDFAAAPNNYLKGTCGALLGALVGAVAYIVLFFMGYISALTSLIAILLGAYLYKKLDGKPNGMMIIIVSVVSISAMLLSVWGIYVLASQALVLEFGFSSTGVQAFKDMMTIPEFSQEFTTNFVMTIFYTILGVIFEIIRLSKSVKRQETIK